MPSSTQTRVPRDAPQPAPPATTGGLRVVGRTDAVDPIALFGDLLDAAPSSATLRTIDGGVREIGIRRWLGPACPIDERVLDRADGPVLDVGCGPGRHLHALARRGAVGVGVEVSPAAVRHARAGGAVVLQRSIFDVPATRRWRSALLLDGNVGIGGDPVALLARVGELLHPGGRILVELEPSGGAWPPGPGPTMVRIESDAEVSRWFPWAWVTSAGVDAVAAGAGLTVAERWADGGREFCALERS
ncbi:class I SAM-dependent methyltransferase [Patulibacter minatonensis]|uniref:class I SAM-dependent methyltransferase n=1 Tax=Patulibacter minatonensis TaxID=298163 RepID=UPI0004BA8B36|nr:class I SAM-dependent methyltransferase [Patulibacter minatonensis]